MASESRLYILAGSHEQAVGAARWFGLASNLWRYVSSQRVLRGLHEPNYVIVGTFHERRDAQAILTAMQMCRGKDLTP